MLPLCAQKGGSKSEFFVVWVTVNGWSSQALSTYFAGQCYQHLMVGRNVYHTNVDCRRDLYLAARPSRRNYLITIWCGLSAAYESHSYARRLPALFEFLDVDIRSTGHTLSRPWSRQLNDVMSEIECAQLHSELFRRRHSTRQSHGLFALAKPLFELQQFIWNLKQTCEVLMIRPCRYQIRFISIQSTLSWGAHVFLQF